MSLRVVLALWMSMFMVLGQAHAEASNPECRFGIESHEAVKKTIWCVAKRLGIPGGPRKAVRIADRETGLGDDEVNDSSGACGIYQHNPASVFGSRYDANMQKRWKPAPRKCLHDRTNIIVSLTMVNRAGWGPWE